MTSLNILGIPLVVWGGITLFILLSLQVMTGLKIIKAEYKVHKYLGIGIFLFVLVHIVLGLLYIYG
jgi:predicted ferric reductase